MWSATSGGDTPVILSMLGFYTPQVKEFVHVHSAMKIHVYSNASCLHLYKLKNIVCVPLYIHQMPIEIIWVYHHIIQQIWQAKWHVNQSHAALLELAKHIELEYQLKPRQVFNVETHLDTSMMTHAGGGTRLSKVYRQFPRTCMITIAGLRFCKCAVLGSSFGIIEVEKSPKEIVGQVDVSGCFSMHVVALILDASGTVGWDVIQLPWIWTCGRC